VFLHNVLYWLKPDLTQEERANFLAGIEDLKRLKSVRAAWFGTPSLHGEAIADRTYTHAIVMDLGDAAGHDAFQVDPEHDAIRKRIGNSWNKILIYDVEGG
jgi:hypothetical protein